MAAAAAIMASAYLPRRVMRAVMGLLSSFSRGPAAAWWLDLS
jgi:hypothetical protein